MTFKTQMAADAAVFDDTDEFGVSGTYTVFTTGAASAIKAVLGPSQDLGFASPGQARLATLMLRRAYVDQPALNDSILIDGVTWRVDQIIGADEVFSTLAVSAGHRVNT